MLDSRRISSVKHSPRQSSKEFYMQKKFMIGSLALVGLSGLVVLGSSPKYLSEMFESAQTNLIIGIFSHKADENPESARSNAIPERPLTNVASTSEQIKPDIPDYVLYDMVFRMDNIGRVKAREQEKIGEMPTAFKYYFKNEAGLTDEEDRILEETAHEFLQEVQPLDAEAQKIIEGGNKGEETHASLNLLQEKRNALVLSNRDKLANRLGEVVFGRFDKYVRENFALKLNSYQPQPE